MKDEIDLSVIIISYNTRVLTLECLRSLYEQSKNLALAVVIVDNSSIDGSADAIAAEFPQVKLIRSGRNLGFALANNMAAKQVTGKWLLLLNPDTVILDRAVEKLLAFANLHREASIFGGRTLFPNRSLNLFSCWRRPTPWSSFCIGSGLSSIFRKSEWFDSEAYGGWQRDTEKEVDVVSGCFFLIRRSLWERLGGFDAAYFMYGEETDLCWRAAKIGERCMICPDAQIIHHGGASEKIRADVVVKLFAAKAMLFSKHWKAPARWFGIRTLDLWAWSRMAAMGMLQWIQSERAESYRTWQSIWNRRAQWRGQSRRLSSDSSHLLGAIDIPSLHQSLSGGAKLSAPPNGQC